MLISLNLDILISLFFSIIIFMFLIWLFIFHKTPKMHILRKVADGYQFVKTMSFKLNDSTKKYKDKVYNLDLKQAIRWKKGKPHIFFDIDNTTPLSFNEDINSKRNSKLFNILTDNKIITSMFGKQTEKILILIIMFLVIGLMISVSFNMYLVQNPEQFIVQNITATQQISPIIP